MTKPRILIVDDSAAIRKSFKVLLEPIDAEIIEAANGRQGFDLAKESSFNIIISDIEMPEMNGIDFCKNLKSNPVTQSIPVVIVSSFDTDDDINKGFEAGASMYISKDEAKIYLKKTVEEILTKSTFQSKRLIMVVDDSHSIRHVVSNGLIQAGFQVITAENGKKALELLSVKQPDLILSDIDMPEMNGFEFCKAVRLNPDLSVIPFLVMSTNTDRGHMNRMLQQGAAAYICKPFNTDQLVIMVEKLLSDQFLLLLKERERLDADRNLMVASITSLVTALEARDTYTRGHSEDVAKIVSGMLGLAGGRSVEIERVIIGCRLHDIGKIGVRDSVLLKPGKLDKVEFDHIKEHPIIGYNILKSIPSLSDIIPIVQFHHERMDGKGYPDGLKGDDIHLWARMTAVADTYHSLISDRPYRIGMIREKALQIISDIKGTQLCPECVDLFLKWVD
jgi:putative two-component system response regulator